MKLDSEGYEVELLLIYDHFESSLHLFLQQSVLSSSSDPVVSKDLGDLTMKDSVIYFSYRITNLCDYKNAGDDGAGLQVAPLESDSTVCLSASIQFGAGGKELLLMNEDLLQDLVLYKKSHEKAVSIAAHSLVTLLREICSSFLVKKDRGHPIDSKARPKAFGEVSVANDVPGVELLKQDDDKPLYSSSEDEMAAYGSEAENDSSPVDNDIYARVAYEEDEYSIENDGESDNEFFPKSGESSGIDGLEDDACRNDSDEEGSDDGELANVCDTEELNEEIEVQAIRIDGQDEDADDGKDPSNRKKRKLGNFVECLNVVDASLCSLKRLVVIKAAEVSTDEADGIVSNEDFQHIKELKHGFCKDYLVHADVLDQAFKLKANKEAKKALSQHGLLRKDEGYKAATSEIPSSEQLSAKRLNPVKLEAHVRSKLSK
ncbi:hypothetical protein HPP92_027649 [Vanilla planifolia]|uniref:Protein SDA1 n=1 Tax=Vanilla planifolia TaxID=51239 RepID=A0A835PB03_VANPL|nr:hypothetical protein HPP92_027649 [Vanilla planifolia]